MNWILLASIAVICYTASKLVQKTALKNDTTDPVSSMVVFQLIGGIIIAIYGLLTKRLDLNEYSQVLQSFNWVFMLFSWTCYAVGASFMFKAIKLIDVSRFSIIFAFRSALTLIFATIFLSEFLTYTQLTGSIIILISIVLLVYKKGVLKEKLSKGDIFALTASLAFAAGIVSDKHLLNTALTTQSLLIPGFIMPGIIVWLTNIRTVNVKSIISKPRVLGLVTLYTALYAFGAITYFSAIEASPNLSIVAFFIQIGVVLEVILGVFLLNEKSDIRKKILLSIITLIGLVLLVI